MALKTSKTTIDDCWKAAGGRPAGFDNLRVILAFAIIVWHTIAVDYGFTAQAGFYAGPLGPFILFLVPAFFSLSGFLVAGSLLRNDTTSFTLLRLLRIYPALAFEVLLSAFLIGPMFTQSSLKAYFTDPKFVRYMLNAIGWIHFQLPGVFLTNPAADVINLQLWTIPYELECYLILIVLAIVGLSRKPIAFLAATCAITLAQAVWMLLMRKHDPNVAHPPGRMAVLCFLFGVSIFLLKNRIPAKFWLFCAALFIFVFVNYFGHGGFLTPPIVAYITVYLGVQNRRLPLVGMLSNYSYGVYLYGFVVQQTVSYLLPQYRIWWVNLVVSAIVTIGVAAISWHLVEKPVDRNKKAIIGKLKALRDNAMVRLPSKTEGNAGIDHAINSERTNS